MMQKMALFVFNGDSMCFIHVLLNALEMKTDGYEAKIEEVIKYCPGNCVYWEDDV